MLAAVLHAPLSPSHNHRPGQRLLVRASTTSAAAVSEDCDTDAAIDACNADAECSACFSGWGAMTSAAGEACEDRFPEATSLCGESGAGFCCNLGDEETASACMRNG